MTRHSTYRLIPAIGLLFALCGCSKSDDTWSQTTLSDATIRFGVGDIIDTRIEPTSNEFEVGDQFGVFAYYDYYYADGSESTAISNQPFTITAGANATYDSGVKWGFSTLYDATARKKFDAVAYYPYAASDQVSFTASALVYTFDPAHDFMVAQTSYATYDGAYYDYYLEAYKFENFRAYLQSIEYIPLTFYRQTSSVTLAITKESDNEGDIVVSGAIFYLEGDVPTTMSFDATGDTYSGNETLVTWGDSVSKTDGDYVSYHYDFTQDYSLEEELTISSDGTQSTTIYIDSFFPSGVEIFKVVLDISGEGANGYTSHTWHPHLGQLELRENYTLNIQIDPGRSN